MESEVVASAVVGRVCFARGEVRSLNDDAGEERSRDEFEVSR